MSANNDFMDSLKNSAQEGMNKLGNDMANVGSKMAEMGKNTLNEIISDATTVTTTVRIFKFFDISCMVSLLGTFLPGLVL